MGDTLMEITGWIPVSKKRLYFTYRFMLVLIGYVDIFRADQFSPPGS